MEPSRIAISYTRFSSSKQANGDSWRRQVQLAENYAAAHGLVIDQQLSFQDLGVSAFDQSNVRTGKLGMFLQAIQRGRVPAGATLIVESLDRLSRATPLDAMQVFREIINAGLTIVTLADGQVFTRESLTNNPYQLFASLVVMCRAHEESAMKSKRGKELWAAKRQRAKSSGAVMTRKTPYWIRTKPDKSGFELIPERAAVVTRLIEESEKGTGNTTLIAQLHAEGISAWSKSGSWQPSYMQKLLRSPALFGAIRLGEELVRDYYPAVIDEDRFHHLQSMRADRASTQCTSGRGKTLSNLFSGRLKCGYCGFSMAISGYKERARKPGRKPYERKYVGCQGARIRDPKGCQRARIWFLDELEPALLFRIAQLDFCSLVEQDRSKVDEAARQLAGLKGRQSECQRKARNVMQAIEGGEAPKVLLNRLKALEAEEVALTNEIQQQQRVVDALEASRSAGQDRLSAFVQAMKQLKTAEDPAKVRGLRQQIAALISGVVDRVTIYPAGPTRNGSKEQRYVTVLLKSGEAVEVDCSGEEEIDSTDFRYVGETG